MSVHPQIQVLLERLASLKLPAVADLEPAQARAQMEAMARARDTDPVRVGHVHMRTIPGPAGEIPVRLYRPLGSDPTERLPVLVYYHGGGHVIGSLNSHDGSARRLCDGVRCLLVSVDYRMGPEHPFPAAVDDSVAALEWVAQHADEIGGDATRLAVGGDSAGGNLAAVVALAARDAGGPALRLQLLVYPVADYTFSMPSYETYARGYGVLEAPTMQWFRRHYLAGADPADWRASPLKAASLAGVAPALVITAECDVLHDEGVAYAAALAKAGVAVSHTDYAGMIHGFFGMTPGVDGAMAAHAEAAAALRRAFA